MTKTPLDKIIKRDKIINRTSKALRIPETIIIPKKKKERAKPPKDDLSEKSFSKLLVEILRGKK